MRGYVVLTCAILLPPRMKLCGQAATFLRAGPNGTLWNGKPWRLWVTDSPNGEGKTFFTLRFAAEI